jgi:protein SCO1
MMSRTQSIALAALVAIVAVAAGMLLSRALLSGSAGSQPVLVSGTLLQPPRPLPPLEFTDHAGQRFDNTRLQGHWSLLFFGFTSCPDVCPQTLGILAQTEKQLADLPAAQRPQVILVSVDPQRDTPAQLAAYVRFFSPSFTGITASREATDEFARQMGVPVAITPLDNGSYTVDHSAAIFLVDPNGALRALFSTPHSPQKIADDYRRITASASS